MLIANLAVSWALLGLIWVIQLVHYPLFAQVSVERWADYHARHTRQITIVVAPLMLAELAIAGLLVVQHPADSLIWISAGIVVAMWVSTFFVQVPIHTALGRAWDLPLIHRLSNTNWIRTIGWTLKAVLAVWLLSRLG